jgi:hypothetical protein
MNYGLSDAPAVFPDVSALAKFELFNAAMRG